MKYPLLALALCLLPAAALAQDKATLDTRQLLAETVTTAKPRTEYLNGTRDTLPAFVRVLAKYRQLTATPVKDPVLSVPTKKAVGVNLSGISWYASRQTFTNLLQGGQWNVDWKVLGPDQIDRLGYPKVWPATGEYKRLLGTPTGGWVADTQIACSWKGTGTLTHNGSTNQVRGDHTLTFTMPSWGGAVKNTWFSLWGVNAADPFREFECHDAKNASGNEFSKEVVASSSKYAVLRFMDWNQTNSNPTRSWATRPDPRTLENPGLAIENQFALARYADADVWFNHSWNDDASYIAGAAKYAHDTLPAGRKVYVELSNETWNWSFPVTSMSADEGLARKIDTNRGYAGLLNYSRRAIDVMKVWEAAFADRPGDLVRVIGTQAANQEVTRQVLRYPGAVDHFDAIASAPYFYHDNSLPYSDALLRAGVTTAITWAKNTCATARGLAPKIRCITYEGGQHELVTAQTSLEQLTAIERSLVMGDAYADYLARLAPEADLIVLFNDVDPITKYGAWGAQEYGGQVGAPKQVAIDAFLKR
jgi:hypothetical protein